MSMETAQVVFAMGQPPGGGSGQQPNPTGQMIQTFSLMAVMVLVFYFLMIRPQQKKQKEHNNLLKTVRPGDKILTSSGIIGAVITVKENSVTIRSADTKMEITKSAIAQITERGEEKSVATS
jgi:preprotein translocase subunit YajC